MQVSSRRNFMRTGTGLITGALLTVIAGCSGGSSEPTKIYEGGGTIPEIEETPDATEGKKSTPAKK